MLFKVMTTLLEILAKEIINNFLGLKPKAWKMPSNYDIQLMY